MSGRLLLLWAVAVLLWKNERHKEPTSYELPFHEPTPYQPPLSPRKFPLVALNLAMSPAQRHRWLGWSGPHRWMTIAGMLLVVLPYSWFAVNAATAQQITDSQFFGVKTTARITRRFEIYDPHSQQELRAIQEMGFTQVILDWPNLHPAATALGLDVVLANWWTHETPPADIERSIDLAKQVAGDHLVGISMMDEPQRNSPETPLDYYVKAYNQLRPRLDRELPGVALEISHWGPLAEWDPLDYHLFADLYRAADVMRIMPYPDLDEGELGDVYLMMQRSRALMKKVNRELPLLVILQAWTLPPKSELPTIGELRVMAYQAMLSGAVTLSFYHYRPEEWAGTPGFDRQFALLMQELTSLSREFADATIEARLSDNGIFDAVLTSPRGEVTTIRVNTKRTRVDGLAPLAIERIGVQNRVLASRTSGGVASRHANRRACWQHRPRCRAR